MEAGLPDGAARSRPAGPLDERRLRLAVEEVTDSLSSLEGRQVELLKAWLRGWRHHWPRAFSRILGEVGERCDRLLDTTPVDPNRYLKLRRIAIENLSDLL